MECLSGEWVSEFLTACGVCKIYHSLTLELVVGDLLRSCSFWNLWIRVSCVFFGTFFVGLLIGTHHREGRGVWGVGNRILRSDLDSTLATSWKKWAGPFVTIGVLLSDFVNIWILFESGFFLRNWYLFQADLLVCNVCCASDSLFSSGWSDYLRKGIISYGGWF
jgi:hypothetical protein